MKTERDAVVNRQASVKCLVSVFSLFETKGNIKRSEYFKGVACVENRSVRS